MSCIFKVVVCGDCVTKEEYTSTTHWKESVGLKRLLAKFGIRQVLVHCDGAFSIWPRIMYFMLGLNTLIAVSFCSCSRRW